MSNYLNKIKMPYWLIVIPFFGTAVIGIIGYANLKKIKGDAVLLFALCLWILVFIFGHIWSLAPSVFPETIEDPNSYKMMMVMIGYLLNMVLAVFCMISYKVIIKWFESKRVNSQKQTGGTADGAKTLEKR